MVSAESESMPLPYLETFSKAAELGNFTAAAKELGLTQAAVSQRIHALEKILKKPLFQRQHGRGLLTEAGKLLYSYAQRILELHAEARRDILGQDAARGGELLIAASSIPGEHLLPALLARFGEQHAEVHTRVRVSDSLEVLAQVERGDVHLGFVGRKTDNPRLEFRFLARDQLVLIVPASHPLRRRKRISIQQLTTQPLILREAGSGQRHAFEQSLEQAGHALTDCRIALELGSNEAIKAAVLEGAGAAVLSIHAVHKEIDAGLLHAVAISGLAYDRDLYIVLDHKRILPRPARLFLTFLETHPISSPAS